MPAKDFFQVAIEESPLNEQTWDDAVTPSRVSTVLRYPPSRTAKLASSPQHLSRADELRGVQGEVPRLIETYEPAGSWSERAYADDLTWIWALAGFDYVHTAGDGVITDPDANVIPVGAHRWVFTKRAGINARTARFRTNYADENVLLEGYGFGLSSVTLNAAGEVSADAMGLYLRRLAADAATVPAVASALIPPLRQGDLFVDPLAGGGPISDFSISVANGLERIRTMSLNPPSDFPDALELADDQVAVTGSIPKRILSGTDMDALMNATTFALTARWRSKHKNIGATAYPYSQWIQMPAAQYVDGDAAELGNKRRHGLDLSFFAAIDEATGKDVTITLVNGVSVIETYA